MKRLRSWHVMDTRYEKIPGIKGKTLTEIASYDIAVVRRKDGTLALCKLWERDGKEVCSTYFAMPNTPADKAYGMAKTLIKHLESRGCAVSKTTRTRR